MSTNNNNNNNNNNNSNNNGAKTSTASSMVDDAIKVRILVVDDDKICLSVTASVLKLFNYEVVTINCPLEALSTLRMNQDSFDIILSDVHMPLMDGIGFQRIVEVEFDIPVILMSADDKKKLLLKSLENGAAFFIVKPPTINDLKNIWQYVISRRKGNNNSSIGKEIEPYKNNGMVNSNFEDAVYPTTTSYANNEPLLFDYQKQLAIVEKVEKNKNERTTISTNPKKPKLIWTTALHNKFLEAISSIGANRAVPKKILEYMNVPGLTRENIASHLQKYRIYVRRLDDSSGSMQHGMPMNWNERPFRSSFSWTQFPTLANNSFLLKYSNGSNVNHNQGRDSIPNYHSQQQNSFLNPNNNTFVQPSIGNNNLGVNYNNVTHSIPNILESSILDPQNNSFYENSNGGDLTSAAMQFITPKPDIYSDTNVEFNNVDGFEGMTTNRRGPNQNPFEMNNDYVRPQMTMPTPTRGVPSHVTMTRVGGPMIGGSYSLNNNNGLMGPPRHQLSRYFDGGLDNNNIDNAGGQVSRFFGQNNFVADNNFMGQTMNIQSNYYNNNEQFSVTNLNIICNDQPIISSSEANAFPAAQQEGTTINISAGIMVAENQANVVVQNGDDHEKENPTINITSASSAPMQNWTHLDDLTMEYGDLSTMFTNIIDAPNVNNN